VSVNDKVYFKRKTVLFGKQNTFNATLKLPNTVFRNSELGIEKLQQTFSSEELLQSNDSNSL